MSQQGGIEERRKKMQKQNNSSLPLCFSRTSADESCGFLRNAGIFIYICVGVTGIVVKNSVKYLLGIHPYGNTHNNPKGG